MENQYNYFNTKNILFKNIFYTTDRELANLVMDCWATSRIKKKKIIEVSRVRGQTGFIIHENYIHGSATQLFLTHVCRMC